LEERKWGMKLTSLFNRDFRKGKRRPALAEELPFEPASGPGLDALQMRLNHWGSLWSAESESTARSAAQLLVAARLTRWMKHCFGQHLPSALKGEGDPISLASSMPLLTAFLGRRATRELSRRVLRDL
jgi:hypothetical protein